MESDGEDLEVIEEDQGVDIQNSDGEGDANQGENAEAEDDEEKQKKVIKPKRVVRNPQVKLNAETLKGSRGLTAVAGLFAKQKFKGKGHEKEDLRVLLKTYNYWCHRMFPKYPFDQAIEKIEKLGNKKPVITHIKKIRMGLLVEEEKELEEEDEQEQPMQVEENRDSEFDALLPAKPVEIQPAQLTEEQLERIRANKEKALKLRQERLRKIQQQAESKLKPSHTLTQSLEFSENTHSREEIVNSQNTESDSHPCSFNDIVDKPQSNEHGNDDYKSSLNSEIEGSSQTISAELKYVEEINVSTLEKDFDSQDTDVVLSSKTVLEKDFNHNRSESPILGRVNFGKEKIPSSTMIQDSTVFEETADFDNMESTTLQVEGLREDAALSDEARLSFDGETVADGNMMEVDDLVDTIIPSKNKLDDISISNNDSEIKKITSTEGDTDIIEDSLSLNVNNVNFIINRDSSNLKDVDSIDNGIIEGDGESESTDFIEDTPEFVQNKRQLVNKNGDCD